MEKKRLKKNIWKTLANMLYILLPHFVKMLPLFQYRLVCLKKLNGTKYSRTDQVKLVKDSL